MNAESASNEEDSKKQFSIYAERIDEEVEFWSGGFERHEDFQRVIDLGEKAIPLLLEDLSDRTDDVDRKNPWWRLQAVGTITHAIGKKIAYPPEIKGRLDLVREATLEWGIQEGYIAEPKPNIN